MSTYSDLKVGDKVYNFCNDKMMSIISITLKSIQLSDGHWYNKDGKFLEEDVNPVIFLNKKACIQYLLKTISNSKSNEK